MTIIKLKLKDQELLQVTTPKLASGGVNENKLQFEFDDNWTGFEKTAIFYRKTDKNVKHAVVSSDNSCIMPWEVATEKGEIFVGVFGNKGEETKTSTVVVFDMEQGAITVNTKPSEPTPDIYSQIMSEFAKLRNDHKDDIKAVTARLDNLTSAIKPGSTTADAELIDIRVGYNDTQYPNAGTAVREQARRLSERILTVKNEASETNKLIPYAVKPKHPAGFVPGKYVNKNGVEVEDSRFFCSGLLFLDGATGFVIKTSIYISEEVAGICFYDRNKKLIAAFNSTKCTQEHITVHNELKNYNYAIPIPKNSVYFRTSSLGTQPDSETSNFTQYFPDFALGNDLEVIDKSGIKHYNGSEKLTVDLSTYEDVFVLNGTIDFKNKKVSVPDKDLSQAQYAYNHGKKLIYKAKGVNSFQDIANPVFYFECSGYAESSFVSNTSFYFSGIIPKGGIVVGDNLPILLVSFCFTTKHDETGETPEGLQVVYSSFRELLN